MSVLPLTQHKEAEVARLEQQVAVLAGRVQELSSPGATDTVPALKKKLWDLEGSAAEQKKELERQTAAVDHLEQVMWGWGRLGCVPTVHIHPHPLGAVPHLWVFQLHERLELEVERMKQIHQKELEDKDEELEDTQKSCQKRVGPCWVGLMLGAPQSSPCPRSPSRGPCSQGSAGVLLCHHPPSVSPSHSLGVQIRLWVRGEPLPRWRGCWGQCVRATRDAAQGPAAPSNTRVTPRAPTPGLRV